MAGKQLLAHHYIKDMNWNKALYVDPHTKARRQVEQWREPRPNDAALIAKIADQPQAIWLNDNRSSLEAFKACIPGIRAANTLPVIVSYNIPHRDLGQYSTGGALTAEQYKSWTDQLADTLRELECIIILEPDALAHLDQLNPSEAHERLQLIKYAVRKLTEKNNVRVYIDAGHPRWHLARKMADRLTQVLASHASGFSLNVSNFVTTDENISYGYQVSRMIGGKPFVIDTSRNGLGPKLRDDGSVEWCNPQGRALGAAPTFKTGHDLVDALLWIKCPGESDGECNGGPKAGTWWVDYALGLATRANW